MYFYPVSPVTLVPNLSFTRGHFPTWASPISVPESPPTARVQLPTRAYPVSVPESRLPALILYLPLVPTEWLSLPISSYYLLPAIFLPGLPAVVYLPPPGATMPLSYDRPPCSPSCLRIFQIPVVTLPTAPHFPFISLYMSSPTSFLLILALLLHQASPMSRQISVVLVSP